jgi:hypothetical protein
MDNILTNLNCTGIGVSDLRLEQESSNFTVLSAQLKFLNFFAGAFRYAILFIELKINNEILS